MWHFGLFVEQDITDKKKIVFSGFVVLTVTNNEFLRFSFSLRTFCKNKWQFNESLINVRLEQLASTTEAKTNFKTISLS